MKTITATLVLVLVFPLLGTSQSVAFDYSAIYEHAKQAIVTVTTEDGSGSGFLVTPLGHIATNFHVIRNAQYLAVQFADGVKVRAEVAAVNAAADMALIKVNSALVTGIQPLQLLDESKNDTVKVGLPVAALGSPFNQEFMMTQGILSKVTDATMLGDFLLQPGNSGGPLLNREGEVIGMNTFGEGSIAGAIRIDALRAVLESSIVAETAAVEPSTDLLPAISQTGYPVRILNDKLAEPFNPQAYQLEAGDFMITAITPLLIARAQVVHDPLSQSGPTPQTEPFYAWQQSTESGLEYTVRFNIQPKSGLTTKSKFLRALWPAGVGRTRDMEFKGAFLEFRLYRDGELIQPITPGRHVVEGAHTDAHSRFRQASYGGLYTYDPSAFLTGSNFRIEIVDGRQPEAVHKALDFNDTSPMIQQIRSDFTYQPGPSVSVTH